MTNAELASLLNDEFDLKGRACLSANVIRQWVDWELLPKARVVGREGSNGPIWERDDAALARARRFAEIRYFGVRSERALVAQTYIEWRAISFDRAKPAILAEFRSARAKTKRRLTADIPEGAVADFPAIKRRALKNQGGPIDAIFQGSQFELSTDMVLSGMRAAFTGYADDREQTALLATALAKAAPSLIATMHASLLPGAKFSRGLFADPEETDLSVESLLQAATVEEFERAQAFLAKSARRFRRLADGGYSAMLPNEFEPFRVMLEKVLPQISCGQWLTTLFAQVLAFQCRENSKNDDSPR